MHKGLSKEWWKKSRKASASNWELIEVLWHGGHAEPHPNLKGLGNSCMKSMESWGKSWPEAREAISQRVNKHGKVIAPQARERHLRVDNAFHCFCVNSLRVPQEHHPVLCQTVCGSESTSPWGVERGRWWCVFSHMNFYMNPKNACKHV